jgi:hypothetical protein
MSWHKTTCPSTSADNPDVLRIGKLGAEAFLRENKPQGFGMFHAKRGIPDQPGSILIVYLSPVASELCPEIFESYEFEPCEAPARDEQDMAWVLGDPWTKILLREWFVEPQLRPTAEEEELAAAQQAQTEEAQQAPVEEAPQAQAAS